MNKIKSFITDDSGATAIEYGLIAALISVVIIFLHSYLEKKSVQHLQKLPTPCRALITQANNT